MSLPQRLPDLPAALVMDISAAIVSASFGQSRGVVQL